MRIGYFLSCEEYSPAELVEQAKGAEEAGFDALWISDHFHPWNDEQGQSPFVWSMIGAISEVCSLPVTTAVTCPTMRIHPMVIAQAAATSAVLLEGRFVLGIGTGEALNEHITGQAFPTTEVRLEMLEESVEAIRKLWTGDVVSHRGTYYTVDTARIYTLPDAPPPIYMSAFGPKAVEVAARIADGFISTNPDAELLNQFKSGAARASRRRPGSRSATQQRPRRVSRSPTGCGPTPACPGELAQVLPSPKHFEQASSLVTKQMTADATTCGKDPAEHLEAFEPYIDAGFDEIYVANMGPHHAEMLTMYGAEVLPELHKR